MRITKTLAAAAVLAVTGVAASADTIVAEAGQEPVLVSTIALALLGPALLAGVFTLIAVVAASGTD